MNCVNSAPLAPFADDRWHFAGSHAAEERHRLLGAVRRFGAGRIGKVVGIAMGHDQHVAGFEAFGRRIAQPGPAAALRDDVVRDQMLRGRQHDPAKRLGLRRPRHPWRMRVDQEQHRAGQPHAAQHVGQNVEAGRRSMRSGRSVMVRVHGVVDAVEYRLHRRSMP